MTRSTVAMGEMLARGLRAALLLLALLVAPLALDIPARTVAAEASLVHQQPAPVGLMAVAPELVAADLASPAPDGLAPMLEILWRVATEMAVPAQVRLGGWTVARNARPAARAPPEMMQVV